MCVTIKKFSQELNPRLHNINQQVKLKQTLKLTRLFVSMANHTEINAPYVTKFIYAILYNSSEKTIFRQRESF